MPAHAYYIIQGICIRIINRIDLCSEREGGNTHYLCSYSERYVRENWWASDAANPILLWLRHLPVDKAELNHILKIRHGKPKAVRYEKNI